MSAEQKYQDYRLRRELVVGHTTFTSEDKQEKAREILLSLERLTTDPAYAQRWLRYYQLVIVPNLYTCPFSSGLTDLLAILSNVYVPYMTESQKIIETHVLPYLASGPGQTLCERLRTTLGSAFDLNFQVLNYFDFYNNTLEKLFS